MRSLPSGGWVPLVVFCGAVLTVVVATAAPPPKAPANGIALRFPMPSATFRPGPGVELAQANCTLCHSPEYLSNQPPFGRTFWKDTVEKMRKNYLAPVPADKVEPLADYLVKAYGIPD